MLWYWLFAGPALVLAALALGGERKRAAYVAGRLSEASQYLPPASVIVPVNGEDQGLRQNLAYRRVCSPLGPRSCWPMAPAATPLRRSAFLVGWAILPAAAFQAAFFGATVAG